MPARNQIDQAFKIRLAVPVPFSLDLIVRKPESIKWRLDEGELFHTEILIKGIVLYEKSNAGVGAQGRSRLSRNGNDLTDQAAPSMIICHTRGVPYENRENCHHH
jgi:hypothetical protein